MAENEDGTEKSEEPSEKKLREAREKGQVPRSKELSTLLMTLSASVFLYFYGQYMMQDFEVILQQGLSFDRSHAFDFNMLENRVLGMVVDAIYLVIPFLSLMVFIALTGGAMIGGWNFSTQAMQPKISKLNPLKGLKKMVSMNALMELLKAFAKFVLIGLVAAYFLWHSYEEVLSIGLEPKNLALSHAAKMIIEAFIFVSLALIVIAAIDIPFQVHQHITQLKMTKQEVKEEYKQQEGNPEIKGRIRQLQREMSQKRMMQKVPEADVIITNPTHFAVALKYDVDEMDEPIVLAIGSDFMASQIRTIATDNDIPIIEAPTLARALYYNAEVDQPIPYELFKAVASILAYVYQLRDGMSVDNVNVDVFKDIPIPEDMKTEE
jgi:flagellar biosynthetic protein FlhB